MTKRAPYTAPVPPWALALAAMLSVQLGSALSVHLIASVGPAGTAWLRLSAGALIFLVLARPPLRAVRPHDVPALLGLGITTGLVTIVFLAVIERIPLGTAVAIEFLGPLTVGAVRSHSARALTWPAVALLGVVLLTEPWHGDINTAGIAFAGLAAIGWAAYILLTQRIGDRFTGIGPRSITAVCATRTSDDSNGSHLGAGPPRWCGGGDAADREDSMCPKRTGPNSRVVAHTVRRASVGDRRAARKAGISPAIAPIASAAAKPPAPASGGITTPHPLTAS